MFATKSFGFYSGICIFALTLIGFQNCSKTNFVSDTSASSQKVDGSVSGGVPNSESGDGPTAPVADGSVSADAGLVECQLGSPNAKIILNSDFETGSNASATRICMSKNACLSIFNAYAAARSCSLSSGAATASAPAGTQCTQVFPGSKGTCHNAKALTDTQVKDML